MVRTQRAGERKKICSLCCTSRQSWEINSTFLRDDLFKPCLREYDCMKRGKYILLPWPPEPAATDRHAISWHHRHGREGGGKQGPGWRTSGIGEIIYYSPNNIAELAENCSNNPVSPPVICPIPLPLLFCKGCCSFCWRSPSEIAMLLPAFWSILCSSWNCKSAFQVKLLPSHCEQAIDGRSEESKGQKRSLLTGTSVIWYGVALAVPDGSRWFFPFWALPWAHWRVVYWAMVTTAMLATHASSVFPLSDYLWLLPIFTSAVPLCEDTLVQL